MNPQSLSMTTSPVISVIVPAYNEETQIAECLESLQRQDFPLPYEVLVVNGPSTDATGAIAARFPFETIQLGQRGIGLAWQTGAAQSRADLLVFTEADTVVPPHWLREIHRLMEENPWAVAWVGGYVFKDRHGIAKAVDYSMVMLADLLHKLWRGKIPFRGKNFAIRRSTLAACGGFNADVDLYGDVELSRRAKRFGETYYHPSLVVETTNRNFKSWADTLRFMRRFLKAMYWIEVAEQPHKLKFPAS